MEKIREILVGLGLSDTEARLYLAMLKLGPASVQNIAKEASLSRTATYDLVAGLQEKGLASTYDRGKKTFYSVEDPETLDEYFRGRAVEINTRLVELRKNLPELRALHGGARPRVRFYSGEEGLAILFRDVVYTRVDILLEVTNLDSMYKSVDEKFLLDLRKIEEFPKIKIRGLIQGRQKHKTASSNVRYMPSEYNIFSGNLWIYKDRVTFVDFDNEISVVIVENKNFSQTMTALFEATWKISHE